MLLSFLFSSYAQADIQDQPDPLALGVRTLSISVSNVIELRKNCKFDGIYSGGSYHYKCDLKYSLPAGFDRELEAIPAYRQYEAFIRSKTQKYNVAVALTFYIDVIRVSIAAGNQDDPLEYFDVGFGWSEKPSPRRLKLFCGVGRVVI